MGEYTIQADYGAFDSRFYGIIVRFDAQHQHAWAKFNELTQAKTPAEFVKIGDAALRGPKDKAIETFLLGTVDSHELRHFHDSILSSHGNQFYRFRITTALNGFQALSLNPANKTVPVPLQKWHALNNNQRNTLVKRWSKLYGDTDIRKDSFLSNPIIRKTVETYNGMKNMFINPNFENKDGNIVFDVGHILEASALFVQSQDVHTAFGEEHANMFINFILNNQQSDRYTRVVRILADKVRRGRDDEVVFFVPIMNAICTWCLLGDYIDEKWNACPTVRFARLMELLDDEGLPDPDTPIKGLFQRWNEKLGFRSVEQVLRHTLEVNERFVKRLKEAEPQYPTQLKRHLDTAISAATMMTENNKYMTSLFLSNIDSYTNPYLYIQKRKEWPAAPIMYTFTGGGMLVDKMAFSKMNMSLVNAVQMNGDSKILVTNMISDRKTDGVDIVDPKIAENAFSDFTLMDFFFCELRCNDPEFNWVRQSLLKKSEAAFVEIFV
jgi:hypothetical protein